jgi:hypothetical protein
VRCLATEPTFSHWPPHLPEAFRRDRVIDLQDLTSDLRSSSTTTTTHERQLPTSRHFLRPPDGSGDGGSVVKVFKQREQINKSDEGGGEGAGQRSIWIAEAGWRKLSLPDSDLTSFQM